MSGEKASDALGAARYAEFDSKIKRQAADLEKKYGAKRGAVEEIIRAHGYEPVALAKTVANSGLTGAPGTGASPDRILAAHREVFAAIAKELGVKFKEGV